MSLSCEVPDATIIHRLLRIGAFKGDYRVTLTDITYLKETENEHHIFRAKTSAGEDVVIKFTYEGGIAFPRLKHESHIYLDYLKPLWGVHVPKFYGLYMYTSLDISEDSCACIILQYCGEPAVSDLSQLKDYCSNEYGIKQFRNNTMDMVFRLHSLEIVHDALNASHILDFKGKPFLVDFTGADSHDCVELDDVEELSRDSIAAKEGEILYQMGRDSVRCDELWMFLKSIEYCIP
ncbi:hypothetical protein C0992_007180, partial [Termitomyces sp. T32_za158]